MANLEERVSALEAHADHHTPAIDAARADIQGLRSEMGQLRGEMAQMRGEMGQLRGETATRADIAEVFRRIDRVDGKVDRLFMWTVGLMVSGFFVIIGALVGVAFRLPG